METLEQVRETLDSIPEINRRGCALAALVMYRWLKQNQPEARASIVYLHEDKQDWSYQTNEKYLKGDKETPGACCHAMLKYNNQLMDSDTTCYKHYCWAIELEMPEDAVVKSLNQPIWNSTFKRGCFLSQIEEAVGVDLSDVEKLHY